MDCILKPCSDFLSLRSEGLRTTKQLRANAGEVVRKGDHSLKIVRNENGDRCFANQYGESSKKQK